MVRGSSIVGRLRRPSLGVLLAGLLSACVGGAEAPRVRAGADTIATSVDPAARPVTALSAPIGTGSVKVALVVPLTGPGATVGVALRNAAELAYEDFQRPDLSIRVSDDRGAPDGARDAAQVAVADGAEIVLGPLFAGNVQAAGAVARAASKPVIAFSTDASVAAQGVYLVSFLPQTEVDRIVDETVAGGRRSFAALIPDTAYGNAVEAALREAVARRGARLVGLERYASAGAGPAVERLRGVIAGPAAQADALFLPDTPEGLAALAPVLTKAGYASGRVRPIGTALWNDPRVLAIPAYQGGWFAAPENAGFTGFAQRYQTRFGAAPPRVASLGYDAVALTATLVRQYGTQRFAPATLTTPAGFAGLDGLFRFRSDGTSERALAVYEVRGNTAVVMSPAPRQLGPSGI